MEAVGSFVQRIDKFFVQDGERSKEAGRSVRRGTERQRGIDVKSE